MTFPSLPMMGLLIVLALSFLVWLWLSALFLLWGARLAGIGRRPFGNAMGTILLGGLATVALTAYLGMDTLANPGWGLLLGFGVSSLIMTAIFETTFAKALAANILAWVLGIVVTYGFALVAALILAAAIAFFTW